MFITIKLGTAGPMGTIWYQGYYQLKFLGLDYADLTLMHEGDLGTTGHSPDKLCTFPTTTACRFEMWDSCLKFMEVGKTRACGVANWELAWLQELVDTNRTLPSVFQQKFHLHQSTAFPRIKAIKDFCDAHGIVFNGYSPLGRADYTTFESSVGTPTTLEEPVVLDIAKRTGKSAAQVILRWVIQQGIPTNPRSMDPAHMKENLDVFDGWSLTDDDMQKLSSMPQCNQTRGNPYMVGDPERKNHDNMIGPTDHC